MNWQFDRLHRTWLVRTSSVERDAAPLKELHRVLPEILSGADFADPDVSLVEVDPWNPTLPAWHRDLHGLGVVGLFATAPHDGPGQILVQKPSTFGGLHWSQVNADVIAEANKPDNLVKLRRAQAGAVAELFVWLSDTVGQMTLDFAAHGLLVGGGERDGPSLPEGLTGVWAASGLHDRDRLARALFFTDGGSWRQLEPPLRA